MGAIGLVVGLGLLGILGPRLETAVATTGSLRVEITYASVTRGGLATPWVVEVRRAGGFGSPISIATSGAYFDGFDFNTLYPEPVEMSTRGDRVVFEFAPPPGDVLRVRLDARATPAWTFWRSAVTTVWTEGVPETSVSYRTVFLP
ncbi:MAG TPA: hypothetical protein VF129_10840 [Actinomycetota bacterium]